MFSVVIQVGTKSGFCPKILKKMGFLANLDGSGDAVGRGFITKKSGFCRNLGSSALKCNAAVR